MARIDPYKLNPGPPIVALLLDDGSAVDERGEVHGLDKLPPGVRVFGSWDQAQALLEAGRGEAYCWDGVPIRWRHRHFDDGPVGWTRRASDVAIFRLVFPPEPERALAGLAGWRDWLAGYGAAPQGSLGSSAMSLLRARLERTLWTAGGELPPVRWTMGGRQELLVPPGSRVDGATHLDLPAAYARTLGELRYGGVWRELEPPFDVHSWARDGRPVFAHATVRVPAALRFGPLPRRPRRRPSEWARCDVFSELDGVTYPTGARVAGTWTWEELAEAEAAGCRVDVDRLWVHFTRAGEMGAPFAQWWEAVQDGRSMGGFAALLAKASANALWGQFAIGDGRREVRGPDGRVRVLPPPGGGMPRSWDLAELVTGRVRARLAAMMRHRGESLLSVHTDGGWSRGAGVEAPEGWLVKDQARRLELLGPQTLRYWRPGSAAPLYCVSGVCASQAPAYFEERWA